MQFRLPFKLGRIMWLPEKHQGSPYVSNLKIIHTSGSDAKEYDMGSGVITTAGVNLWAEDWTNTSPLLKLANYHASGTGTTTPAINQTSLQVDTGIARASGTQSNSLNVYQTVATIIYNGNYTITEWGLFTASTGGTMVDRKTFTGIAVQNNDELQFIWQLTLVAGS